MKRALIFLLSSVFVASFLVLFEKGKEASDITQLSQSPSQKLRMTIELKSHELPSLNQIAHEQKKKEEIVPSERDKKLKKQLEIFVTNTKDISRESIIKERIYLKYKADMAQKNSLDDSFREVFVDENKDSWQRLQHSNGIVRYLPSEFMDRCKEGECAF